MKGGDRCEDPGEEKFKIGEWVCRLLPQLLSPTWIYWSEEQNTLVKGD
jgi:hypothetical protein